MKVKKFVSVINKMKERIFKDSQFGYAVAEFFKNGRFKCFWNVCRSNSNHTVSGVSGFGELYYSKRSCQRDVDALNKLWPTPVFKCVRAKLELM